MRARAMLSRAELALRLGVDETTMKKWEDGERRATTEALSSLAKMAGVTFAALAGGGEAWDLAVGEQRRAERAEAKPCARSPSDINADRRAHQRKRLDELPSCRTERGCPVARGWCSVCQREVDNVVPQRFARNLARLRDIQLEADEEEP